MKNKEELIVVGTGFLLVVGLAMYMFVSQQKNNNMVKDSNELKTIIEKANAEIKSSIDSINVTLEQTQQRLDETDAKYHNQ